MAIFEEFNGLDYVGTLEYDRVYNPKYPPCRFRISFEKIRRFIANLNFPENYSDKFIKMKKVNVSDLFDKDCNKTELHIKYDSLLLKGKGHRLFMDDNSNICICYLIDFLIDGIGIGLEL